MPAVPLLLLVSWPMVPATCVPCAVEIDRQIVVPDEVARRDEARRSAGAELRRGGKRHVDDAERRIERPVRRHAEREARVVAQRDRAKRHAAVEHGDDDVGGRAGLDVPGALHVDGGEVPLIRVQRVVGPRHRVVAIARLRVFDIGPRAHRRRGRFRIASIGNVDDVEVGPRRSIDDLAATCAVAAAPPRGASSLNLTMIEPRTYGSVVAVARSARRRRRCVRAARGGS